MVDLVALPHCIKRALKAVVCMPRTSRLLKILRLRVQPQSRDSEARGDRFLFALKLNRAILTRHSSPSVAIQSTKILCMAIPTDEMCTAPLPDLLFD